MDPDSVPDEAPAKFVRWIEPGESKVTLRNSLKHLMWTTRREHAVLFLENLGRVIVSGGFKGMSLEVVDGRVVVEVDGVVHGVKKLLWHTHPMVTGPSDADFEVLRRLGQRDSVVYEMGGEPEGTVFRLERGEAEAE